ncbi:DegV family protein [Eubacterium sp. 1001713B170207_170306_E7]|uniref:DegV family protein n=1 Tax=Eubacterium sp. 1001713B170207_170306_E7 TaxID=2787097 RepID=UPI001896D58A|nr:DegV family protein [Eubacterium sp. 1001713B170207_170306_E7]
MNKEKIAVLTDSCADIPKALIDKHDLHILPLKIIFSDRAYTDGADITAAEVYDRLPQEIPKTSLPAPEEVRALFQKIYDKGYRRVFAIIFSSGLSGTYNLVRLIGSEFEGLTVHAVDTLSGSLGTGAIAVHTAELIGEGRSFGEIKTILPRLIANTRVYFSIDTLEYLQKGGRIGRITAMTGTLLNVKPIITFDDDGQLMSVAKVRGRRKSIQKMIDLASSHAREGMRYILMVANGGCPEEMAAVREHYTRVLPDFENLYEGEVDCTLGTHVGPHLLGAGILVLGEND